jgi:hypothetical protein
MAKKANVDLGKGFKRIYFVIAALYLGFVFIDAIGQFSACVLYARDPVTLRCLGYNATGYFIESIFAASLVVPLYYFLRWIAAGFKK